MKIDINKIPLEGLTLKEETNASRLDLETDTVKFFGPIKIKAEVSRITNAVDIVLNLKGLMRLSCSRCLKEFDAGLQKNLRLNYQADKAEPIIDLDQDIKEEIILEYPVKPLCSIICKGLCPRCGQNLNEGACNCLKSGGKSATT